MTTKKTSTKEPSTEPWAYHIEKSRFGLYTSVLTACGTRMTTALTEEACHFVTQEIRIPVLRGEYDGVTSTLGTAVVGGKL